MAPSKRVDLGGVFPPMPTPFNPDESVNYDKFATNIEAWNKAPFKGKCASIFLILFLTFYSLLFFMRNDIFLISPASENPSSRVGGVSYRE